MKQDITASTAQYQDLCASSLGDTTPHALLDLGYIQHFPECPLQAGTSDVHSTGCVTAEMSVSSWKM